MSNYDYRLYGRDDPSYGYDDFDDFDDLDDDFDRPSLSMRLLKGREFAPNRELFLISLITGLGLLAYLGMANIYSFVIVNNGALYGLYTDSLIFRYAAEVLYTLFCVGLPFLVVWVLLRVTRLQETAFPLDRSYNRTNAALLVVIGIGVCFAGNVITSLIANYAQVFGLSFYSYEEALQGTDVPDGAFGIFLFFLRTAVCPAITEELVFRGVVMQPLRRYGDWFAIVTTALLFGLTHGNMTQMPFALIAGIALGYASTVSGTLWTGVIIHMVNNSISAVYAIISEELSASAGMIFSSVATYTLIGLGLLALVLFALKNPCFSKLYANKYRYMKYRFITYILAPTTFIAVIILVRTTLYDIVGFGK